MHDNSSLSPHGRSSSCSLLILSSHTPSAAPQLPTDSICPHLFPTVSCHSLHPLSTDHFPYRSPAQPSAFTSCPDLSSFSTHRPPFPHPGLNSASGSTLQACPHALPTKCKLSRSTRVSCPSSALRFILLDLISCLSFPSNLLTLPSKTFVPDQQSLPHP